MSYDAQTWAIKQRGLKPVTKIVLWNLADRHNKDLGYCFVKQTTLADDCEVSRASLNRHLNELEALGLIQREQRKDATTGQQERTHYRLSFDDFGSALHVVGRVSDLDMGTRVSKSAKSVSHSRETLRTSKRTNKLPLTPEATRAPALPDVVEGRAVHSMREEDLYRACCRISGHPFSSTDRTGAWFFSVAVISDAEAEIARGLL